MKTANPSLIIPQIDPEESAARENPICLGCMKEKPEGSLTCWDCFKYRTDVTPLKYYTGSFKEWLEYIDTKVDEESNKYRSWMEGK